MSIEAQLNANNFMVEWMKNNKEFNKQLEYKGLYLFDLIKYSLIQQSEDFTSLEEIVQMINDKKLITTKIMSKKLIIKYKLAKQYIKFKLITTKKKQAEIRYGIANKQLVFAEGHNSLNPMLQLINNTPFLIIKPIQIPNNSARHMKKLIKENYLETTPEEMFLNKTSYINIKKNTKRIENNLKYLLKDKEFQKSFTHKKVNFFNSIKNTIKNILIKRGRILEMITHIELIENILIQTEPKIVYVVEDVNLISRILVKLAKQNKIPSIYIQHGIMNKKEAKFPLICDNIFVWGKEFKKYIEEGQPNLKGKVFVTGILK